MRERPVVVVSQRLGALKEEHRRLEAAGADLRSLPLWTPDEIRANGADADVIILGAVEPFDAEALAALPATIAVVRHGVGVDNVDVEAATRLGILVANVPDASVEEVSDHAFALLLALERRIVPVDAAVHAGVWQKDPSGIAAVRAGIRRLDELTLGIVGFGRIGQALARKARPVYRRLLTADPVTPVDVAAQHGAELVPLEELLREADHISLHAPLLPSTRHLIDDAALASLRPGAVLVNTSRGGLVDQDAVVRALSGDAAGRIGGIALDVTDPEPLSEGHPLLGAPGLVLTAHSAATSTTAGQELARRSVDAALAVIEGRRPDSLVNPPVLEAPNLRATELRVTA
jgi:D-3-phosphoglycerate dehydrogenase